MLIASVTATSVSAAPVKVHKGDTLWDIARDHDATVDQLMNVNNLHSSLIHPNQIIYVSEQYTVKPGDTLSGIAYDYGTTVKDIKATNNLKSDLILIGQVLTIKGDSSPQVAFPTKSDQAETKEPVVDQKEAVSEEPTTKPKDKVEEPQEAEEVAEPVEKTEALVTEPEEETSEEPVTEPKEEKTEEPVEEPKEKKTEEPVEEPKEEKAEESVEETVTESEEETSEEPEADEKEEVVEEEANEEANEEASSTEDSKATNKAAPSNTNEKVTENKPVAEQATPVRQETKSEDKAEGNVINATATAYTAKCVGCSGITATGVDLNANPNAKVIAVDPSVIPLGSQVYVEGYGYAVAADTGGSIKGNKVDVHLPTKAEAINWGNRAVKVTIIK